MEKQKSSEQLGWSIFLLSMVGVTAWIALSFIFVILPEI